MFLTARLTDSARFVLALAKQQDRCRRRGEASADAVLFALLEEHGAAARVLQEAGIEPDTLRSCLLAKQHNFPETATARSVVENANEEALRLGKPYVSTEHLLLGVTRLETTRASQALKELGFDHQRAVAEVDATLNAWVRLRPSWPRRFGASVPAVIQWIS